MPFFGALDPVVSVVADGADQLFFRNVFDGRLEVVREPVLRGDRAGRSAGKVLVVIHDDDAIDGGGDCLVVEILVAHLHADVELHSLGVQVGGEFVEQRDVARLAFLGKGFEIDHQAAIVIGGEKEPDLTAKTGAGCGILEEVGDAGNEVGAVKVLNDGKDFHVGVFRLQKRHDLVVDGTDGLSVNHVEHCVGFANRRPADGRRE